LSTRARFSAQAYFCTAAYDGTISAYLGSKLPGSSETSDQSISDEFTITQFDRLQGLAAKLETEGSFPDHISLLCDKNIDLRYGENPHQRAALYTTGENEGVANVELLGGKEMSFNNYV